MKIRQILLSISFGVAVGLAVASVMTVLDWRLNPGDIFHGAQGTDWAVVAETALSWFAPIFVLASVLALPVALWFSRRC